METVTGNGRNPAVPVGRARVQIGRWLAIALLMVVVAGVLIGVTAMTYAGERARERAAALAELSSISALKVRLIRDWRDERILDSTAITTSPPFRADVERLLHPEAPGGMTYAEAWLDVAQELDELTAKGTYPIALLVDRDGRTLQASISKPTAMAPETRRLIEQVINHGAPLIGEPYRDPHTGRVRLDVAGPVADSSGEAVAVVVIRIDPNRSLFPNILAWPGAADSGETLLVRRDGDRVTYLSPLQDPSGEGFRTVRTDQRQVPAVVAAMGLSGSFEGVDYRGERVLAHLGWVGGSRWALVTKIDLDEVLARSDQAGLDLVVRTVLLLLLLVVAVVLVHLVRQRRLLGRVIEAERDRTKAAERYDRLLARASEVVLLVDGQDRIVEVNAAAVAAYGHDADTLRTMTLRQLQATHAPRAAKPGGTSEPSTGREGDLYETEHRRRDGTAFPVEVSTRSVEIRGVMYRETLVRDITERRAVERELHRQVDELQRWRAGAIGREGRILDLKAEVNDALALAGQPPRYRSVIDGADATDG